MHRVWPRADSPSIDDPALLHTYSPTPRGEPSLRVNAVASVDGAISVNGRSRGLSSPADKRVLGVLRSLCDALLVGAGTAREEEYGPLTFGERRVALRRELGLADHPPLVIVSRRLRIDPDHPMMARAPVRPIVLTTASSPAERRRRLDTVAEVIVVGDTAVDLVRALAELRDRGLSHVLCEGGPTLVGALVAQDLVDDLCLTIAPLLVGGGPGRLSALDPNSAARSSAGPHPAQPNQTESIWTPRSLALRHILHEDGILFLRYTRPTVSHRSSVP